MAEQTATNNTAPISAEKKKITVTQVLADLANGIDRKGIREKYGLKQAELELLFQHPKLKNRKVKKAFVPSFELVDDTDEGADQAEGAEVPQQEESGPLG